jgi:glycosyltransferase involved in cell wall biosynthesis
MNIAHLIPAHVRYPLIKHNGRYEWVLRLAQAQAAQGHTVTIYCAPGSAEPSGNVQWASIPVEQDSSADRNTSLCLQAFSNPEHEVFHSHFDSLHYRLATHTTKPLVATQHWFPTERIVRDAKYDVNRHVTTVAVTNFMKREDDHLGIPCSYMIHHGVDLSAFRYNSLPRSDRLLFVGRIAPHKGVKEAVEAAVATNSSLDIVGKINATDTAYWDDISPKVDGERIRYLGAKPRLEVAALIAQAKAMLFLPKQIEAFGQTILEAQACGTPVVVNDLGANRELLQDGTTGFVVNDRDVSTIAAAIQSIPHLKSRECRMFAETFNQAKMLASYLSLYRNLSPH